MILFWRFSNSRLSQSQRKVEGVVSSRFRLCLQYLWTLYHTLSWFWFLLVYGSLVFMTEATHGVTEGCIKSGLCSSLGGFRSCCSSFLWDHFSWVARFACKARGSATRYANLRIDLVGAPLSHFMRHWKSLRASKRAYNRIQVRRQLHGCHNSSTELLVVTVTSVHYSTKEFEFDVIR